MLLQKLLVISLILLLDHPVIAAAPSSAESAVQKPFQSIKIFPGDVLLASRRSRQRILVQGYYADGYSEDITNRVKLAIGDGKVARVASGVITPLDNGSTVVTAKLGSLSASAPVAARNIDQTPKWSFRNHVIPVLTKTGCNMGACHGASAGKNGFKLTLRGYDPEADYSVLTREAVGRRVSPQDPGRSLVLLKPALLIPHAGGRRFGVESLENTRCWPNGSPKERPHRLRQTAASNRSLSSRVI